MSSVTGKNCFPIGIMAARSRRRNCYVRLSIVSTAFPTCCGPLLASRSPPGGRCAVALRTQTTAGQKPEEDFYLLTKCCIWVKISSIASYKVLVQQIWNEQKKKNSPAALKLVHSTRTVSFSACKSFVSLFSLLQY